MKKTYFTMMVCGPSGSGRSTFINCLCNDPEIMQRYDDMFIVPYSTEEEDPMRIDITQNITLEDNVQNSRIVLTVVDTPGFGQAIDNTKSFDRILAYIQKQYDDVLAEESRIKRNPKFKDNRVHVCIYFIEPTSHGLREMDVEFLSRVAPRVNVIPVIGHADQLTTNELALNKRLIMEDIHRFNIPIYTFPYDDEDEEYQLVGETDLDSSEIIYSTDLLRLMPFGLVCSTEKEENRYVRAYPWGVVEVENRDHSDFVALKQALLGTHLNDLKDITHDVLYENYRTEKLSKVSSNPGSTILASSSGQVTESTGASSSSKPPGVNYTHVRSRAGASTSDSNMTSPDSSFSSVASNAYRQNRLHPSRTLVNITDSYIPENAASEQDKFKEFGLRVHREIEAKKIDVNALKEELREMEAKISSARPEVVQQAGLRLRRSQALLSNMLSTNL